MSLPPLSPTREEVTPRHGAPSEQGAPASENLATPRSLQSIHTRDSRVPPLNLTSHSDRKRHKRRKSLDKNRIYLGTPDKAHGYLSERFREPGSIRRESTLGRSVSQAHGDGRKIVFDHMFRDNHGHRPARSNKAMIIGERPSLWRVQEMRRPELPGNLFVDNLRHKHIDYRTFSDVTWNDILESHLKDVGDGRDFTQTLPQKEQWLASIDARVRYSKMNPNRVLPFVSPRLFNDKVSPLKPVGARYISKDKAGNVFYIVGPGDVTRKEYRPYVLPEIEKEPKTPKKYLDF